MTVLSKQFNVLTKFQFKRPSIYAPQTKAVPDNRRQAESLSLSREVCWSRAPQALGPPPHRPLLHSASGPHTGLDTGATAASAKLTKLQELQDKKQTMDKILQELHSLRDQTLNNNSCKNISFAFLCCHSLCVCVFLLKG